MNLKNYRGAEKAEKKARRDVYIWGALWSINILFMLLLAKTPLSEVTSLLFFASIVYFFILPFGMMSAENNKRHWNLVRHLIFYGELNSKFRVTSEVKAAIYEAVREATKKVKRK